MVKNGGRVEGNGLHVVGRGEQGRKPSRGGVITRVVVICYCSFSRITKQV